MTIYSRLNTATNEYYVYIGLVGFGANVPKDRWEKAETPKERLTLMVEYSEKIIYETEFKAINPEEYVSLELYKGDAVPSNAYGFLGYLAYISDQDTKEYKYLTVDYRERVDLHKDLPEWREDYWYSEKSERIGNLPSYYFDDSESVWDYDEMVENVFALHD